MPDSRHRWSYGIPEPENDIPALVEMNTIQEAIRKQREYCDEHELPHFAPPDGICYSCGRQIYGPRGIPLDEAARRLVTGCPFCLRTYVD